MAAASRVAVLTGCTRGLGLALVEAFAAAGVRVAGCGRSAAGVAALAARFPAPRHLFAVVDVGDDAAVAAFAAAVRAWSSAGSAAAAPPPPPLLVVANAAVMLAPAPLWQVSAADFDALVRVNVCGVANTVRHFAPLLLENASGGVFVALSSYWGRSSSAGVAAYNASKFAVEGLSGALAQDFAKAAPKRVAAVAMNPGVIHTDMLEVAFGASGAAQNAKPSEWVTSAAPFLLGMTARDNGASVTVPGF